MPDAQLYWPGVCNARWEQVYRLQKTQTRDLFPSGQNRDYDVFDARELCLLIRKQYWVSRWNI